MKKELEIYIHIPFCVKKCNYCDFLSFSTDENTKNKYVEALLKQIKIESSSYKNHIVSTIYIGGGTPSVLSDKQLISILNMVKESFQIKSEAEITIEINPGTVDFEKLKALKIVGFNRLSIGLQSADDDELKMLGRIHTYEDFLKTYEFARNAGFLNISVDVMTALPGQNKDKLSRTLDKVIDLNPEHISAYSLIIEENTPFYEKYKNIEGPVVGEKLERELYWYTVSKLEDNGYIQYEISNFSKPSMESKHNSGYWTRKSYLGLGLSASSFIKSEEERRIRNVADMNKYIDNPMRKDEEEIISVEDAMDEFMFLGLRMMKGVKAGDFSREFGEDMYEVYGEIIKELEKKKLIENHEDVIRLTRLGVDYGNYVFSRFVRM